LKKDTEFPGTVVKRHSISQYYSPEELDYMLIWHNVEQTKLIQVGLTLAHSDGSLPPAHTWQFHLAFDLDHEPAVPESVALLQRAGIPFQQLPRHGIPPPRFAEVLISSGTPTSMQASCSTSTSSGWCSTVAMISPTFFVC
jgi:hypothetical protein